MADCTADVWISGCKGAIPHNAIVGGHRNSAEQHPMYVGRACHNGEVIPGKIIPVLGVIYLPGSGKEYNMSEYEALIENDMMAYSWESSSNGGVPCNAVQGGKAANGEILYIGRFCYDGAVHIGKIQPTSTVCSIGFHGKEMTSSNYEVLVGNPKLGSSRQKVATWVSASGGCVPSDAVIGGRDGCDTIYIGRAPHNDGGALLPGRVVPSHKVCYVGTDWQEFPKSNYEVLVGSNWYEWVYCQGSNIPENAVIAGNTYDKKNLYIARVNHNGVLTPGKGHRESSSCYIPYGGKEHNYKSFEVLVWK